MKTKFLVLSIGVICCSAFQVKAQELMGFGLDEPEVLINLPADDTNTAEVGKVIPFNDEIQPSIETVKEQVAEKQKEVVQKVEGAAAAVSQKLEQMDEKITETAEMVESLPQEAAEKKANIAQEMMVETPAAELKQTTATEVPSEQNTIVSENDSLQDAKKAILPEKKELKKVEPVAETKENEVTSEVVDTVNEDEEVVAEQTVEADEETPTPESFVKNMNLTAEQIEKAKQIRDESRKHLAEIEAQIENLRQQAHQLEAHAVTEFESILNDEQLQQFQEFKKIQNGM